MVAKSVGSGRELIDLSTIILFAPLVTAAGVCLGKLKVGGISLGAFTFVLL